MPNIQTRFEATMIEINRRRVELVKEEAAMLQSFNVALMPFGWRMVVVPPSPINNAHTTLDPRPPSPNGKPVPARGVVAIRTVVAPTASDIRKRRKGHKQIRGHYVCRFCQRKFGYAHHLGRHLRAIHSRRAR